MLESPLPHREHHFHKFTVEHHLAGQDAFVADNFEILKRLIKQPVDTMAQVIAGIIIDDYNPHPRLVLYGLFVATGHLFGHDLPQ